MYKYRLSTFICCFPQDGEAGAAAVHDGVVAQDGVQAKAIWRLREAATYPISLSLYIYICNI